MLLLCKSFKIRKQLYRFVRSPEEKIQQTSQLTQFTFSAINTHSFVYMSNAVSFHSMTFLMSYMLCYDVKIPFILQVEIFASAHHNQGYK